MLSKVSAIFLAALFAVSLLAAIPSASASSNSGAVSNLASGVSKFSSRDIEKLRTMVASEVLKKLGATKNSEKTLVDVLKNTDDGAISLDYPGVSFAFKDGAIEKISVSEKTYRAFRGIYVGMNDKTLLKLFSVEDELVMLWINSKKSIYEMFSASQKSSDLPCKILLYEDDLGNVGYIYLEPSMRDSEYVIQYYESDGKGSININIVNNKIFSYSIQMHDTKLK